MMFTADKRGLKGCKYQIFGGNKYKHYFFFNFALIFLFKCTLRQQKVVMMIQQRLYIIIESLHIHIATYKGILEEIYYTYTLYK